MKKLLQLLPYPVTKDYLNEWLKKNVDKKELEENYLDGHGYYKDGDSSITVYVVKKVPLIFMFNTVSEDYTWKIIGDEEWTKWKNVKKAPFKMTARF